MKKICLILAFLFFFIFHSYNNQAFAIEEGDLCSPLNLTPSNCFVCADKAYRDSHGIGTVCGDDELCYVYHFGTGGNAAWFQCCQTYGIEDKCRSTNFRGVNNKDLYWDPNCPCYSPNYGITSSNCDTLNSSDWVNGRNILSPYSGWGETPYCPIGQIMTPEITATAERAYCGDHNVIKYSGNYCTEPVTYPPCSEDPCPARFPGYRRNDYKGSNHEIIEDWSCDKGGGVILTEDVYCYTDFLPLPTGCTPSCPAGSSENGTTPIHVWHNDPAYTGLPGDDPTKAWCEYPSGAGGNPDTGDPAIIKKYGNFCYVNSSSCQNFRCQEGTSFDGEGDIAYYPANHACEPCNDGHTYIGTGSPICSEDQCVLPGGIICDSKYSSIPCRWVHAIPEPDPPVASFTVNPNSGCYPLTVTLTNNSTDAGDYNWNYGDGQTSTSNLYTHTHTYSSGGDRTYTITLTAVNAGTGESDTDTKSVTVSDCCPKAEKPEILYLDKVAVVDEDGQILGASTTSVLGASVDNSIPIINPFTARNISLEDFYNLTEKIKKNKAMEYKCGSISNPQPTQ